MSSFFYKTHRFCIWVNVQYMFKCGTVYTHMSVINKIFDKKKIKKKTPIIKLIYSCLFLDGYLISIKNSEPGHFNKELF